MRRLMQKAGVRKLVFSFGLILLLVVSVIQLRAYNQHRKDEGYVQVKGQLKSAAMSFNRVNESVKWTQGSGATAECEGEGTTGFTRYNLCEDNWLATLFVTSQEELNAAIDRYVADLKTNKDFSITDRSANRYPQLNHDLLTPFTNDDKTAETDVTVAPTRHPYVNCYLTFTYDGTGISGVIGETTMGYYVESVLECSYEPRYE